MPFCLTRAIAMAAHLHPAMYGDRKSADAMATQSTAAAASTATGDAAAASGVRSSATDEKPTIPEHVAILMVVQADEKNIIDQKLLEFILFNEYESIRSSSLSNFFADFRVSGL